MTIAYEKDLARLNLGQQTDLQRLLDSLRPTVMTIDPPRLLTIQTAPSTAPLH